MRTESGDGPDDNWNIPDHGKHGAGLDARALYDNPKFADVRVRFDGEDIHAHRAILSSGSEWFREVLESTSFHRPTKQHVIVLEKGSRQALTVMLRWFYGFQYHGDHDYVRDSCGTGYSDHLDVAIVAEEYGVKSLEREAGQMCDSFLQAVYNSWSTGTRTSAENFTTFDWPKFLKHALTYSDQYGLLEDAIADMSGTCIAHLFELDAFRTLRARYPDLKLSLFDHYFEELMHSQKFRHYLETDGYMRLWQQKRSSNKAKLAKDRRQVERCGSPEM